MATMSSRIRKGFFWVQDFLKGNPVGNDITDIRRTIENGNLPQKSLDKLLLHACATAVFYRDCLPARLESFPIINKILIREKFDEFISTKFSSKELIPVVTSGSTGTPFKVFHHARKKIRNNADTIYFASLAGFEPGHRLAYLKIWAKEKMASTFQYWVRNMIPVDVIHLNDTQIEKLIRSMENDRSTFGILGYVSALELVCQYLDRSGKTHVNTKVSSILTMSESLNDYVRMSMEKYFKCKVFSRYSNLENGIIAQQVPGSDRRFLINSASYFVEVLKMNEDVPVSRGEAGRIIVTDLFNFAMPLVRYDTGDIGIISESDEIGRIYFEAIEGRKLDMLFDTHGNIVSSYIMYKNMWKYNDIKQYQLIQKDKRKYVLKVNADAGFNREKQLKEEFCSYLGQDADFNIEYVNGIPLLDSGKRRKLVNEMIQKP
jgi:phenylacetate-CoA ligase